MTPIDCWSRLLRSTDLSCAKEIHGRSPNELSRTGVLICASARRSGRPKIGQARVLSCLARGDGWARASDADLSQAYLGHWLKIMSPPLLRCVRDEERHSSSLEKRRLPRSESPSRPSTSRSGLRGFWMRRTPCGPSAARPSPSSTPSSNPPSSTCSATPSPIRWGGRPRLLGDRVSKACTHEAHSVDRRKARDILPADRRSSDTSRTLVTLR